MRLPLHPAADRQSRGSQPLVAAHLGACRWAQGAQDSASTPVRSRAPIFTGDLLRFQSQRCQLAVLLRPATGFSNPGPLRRFRPAMRSFADRRIYSQPRPGWPTRPDPPGFESRAPKGVPTLVALSYTSPPCVPNPTRLAGRIVSSWSGLLRPSPCGLDCPQPNRVLRRAAVEAVCAPPGYPAPGGARCIYWETPIDSTPIRVGSKQVIHAATWSTPPQRCPKSPPPLQPTDFATPRRPKVAGRPVSSLYAQQCQRPCRTMPIILPVSLACKHLIM